MRKRKRTSLVLFAGTLKWVILGAVVVAGAGGRVLAAEHGQAQGHIRAALGSLRGWGPVLSL